MINWSKVLELRDDVGPDDFSEIVELFLDEMAEIIAVLGRADRSLEHDLHFLKGSALNLGFEDFCELCRVGESAASEGNGDRVNVDAIVVSYQKSKSVFVKNSEQKLAS